MTPVDVVEAIVKAYRKSREPLYPHAKLSRGESRSVASETEDLLAFYLAERIPGIEQIFINQPMVAGKVLFKPDLVITQASRICALADVKMDLGYKRDKFDSTLRLTEQRIQLLRGQTISFLAREGEQRVRQMRPMSLGATYLFVVVSDRNIRSDAFERIEEIASSLASVRLYVLTRSCHPNKRFSKDEVMKRITVCHDAFESIEREIRRVIAEPPA